MMNRMTSTTVTFTRPFIIGGFDEVQVAGSYTVDTEEEQIAGLSFAAWKRTLTTMQVSRAGATEHVTVDPRELAEALLRDAANAPPPPAPRKPVRRKKF